MKNRLFPLVLLLINISYGQMISLGPFTLLESMESARAKCISLKHSESFGSLEQYVADDGGKFPFQLMFSGNQVYSISMIADNSSYVDYERAVKDFTKTLGRYPDNKYGPNDVLPWYGSVWWWYDQMTFDITFVPKMNRVILNLKPRYEN
ncbi:MAG: hypothetical protein HN936_01245 [Bacteroidetes bacterium]|jgi:hypothetical protein|nr:hypothetical protein [Bacteroidota bacterium]